NPSPRRVHYEEAVVPDWLASERAIVDIKITLDEVGRIAEARVLEMYQPSALNPDNERARQAKDALKEAALASIRQWRYDAPFEAPLTFTVPVRLGKDAEVMAFQPKAQVAFQTKSDDGTLRIGGNIKAPKKIKDVPAVYPPIAREAGVSGVVIIETKIGADGFIEDARVLKSIPLLDEAALDAVRQWQFEPTLLNGRPVPVMMTTTVNFFLQ
ncbi:MAG TPA: energy transducer TonB, partial [Vicinamibacterales bacterium]|nr:energy transducer TonB [Vicinamibacterales bacterium]